LKKNSELKKISQEVTVGNPVYVVDRLESSGSFAILIGQCHFALCFHLGMVVHTCNSCTWVAQAGRIMFKASLWYIARPCLKHSNKQTKNFKTTTKTQNKNPETKHQNKK
jgi:hypothetical protein